MVRLEKAGGLDRYYALVFKQLSRPQPLTWTTSDLLNHHSIEDIGVIRIILFRMLAANRARLGTDHGYARSQAHPLARHPHIYLLWHTHPRYSDTSSALHDLPDA